MVERTFKKGRLYTVADLEAKGKVQVYELYAVCSAPDLEYWFTPKDGKWQLSHTWTYYKQEIAKHMT